jgi:hypothetical protein
MNMAGGNVESWVQAATLLSCYVKTRTAQAAISDLVVLAYNVDAQFLGLEISKDLKR